MRETRYCPLWNGEVVIDSNRIQTPPMGKTGVNLHAVTYCCSCEEMCHYLYECKYSSEGKILDPNITSIP